MHRGCLWLSLWMVLAGTAAGRAETFDVRRFGARGDKESLDTAAIQAAVDACLKAGGGTVLVPPGDYRCGTIRLGSHLRFQVEAGATVWSSTQKDDYRGDRCLLLAREAEGLTICGPGTLRGLGEGPLGRLADKSDAKMPAFRPGILRLENCRDVVVRDLRVLYSDTWTLHFRFCENVLIEGVEIDNEYLHVNSDGIDPVSCRNVRIANCRIVAGDDCIVCKTAEGKPCEHIAVSNCTLESIGTAVKLGTESSGDFRDIRFSGCSVRNSGVGIGLYMKDGGTMERIAFSDMDLEVFSPRGLTNVEKSLFPIFIDIERRHKDSKAGKIRDVTFANIRISSGLGALIQGMPESPIENLSLCNIHFRATSPVDQSERRKRVGGRRTMRDERDTLYSQLPAWLAVAHVNRLVVDQLSVCVAPEEFARFPRSVLYGAKLEDVQVKNISRQPAEAEGTPPVVVFQDCLRTRLAE